MILFAKPPVVLPPEPPKEPPKYMPPVSKPWISYGSEKEIDEGIFTDKRPLVRLTLYGFFSY